LLAELHRAVLAAGDAMGILGFSITRGGSPSGMEALQTVFRCPLGRCAGRLGERVTGPVPVCAISQQPLTRERL